MLSKDRKNCSQNENSLSSTNNINKSNLSLTFGNNKSSSNKYIDETNKNQSIKRASQNVSITPSLASNEEYDPENALYSPGHLNKKPKLDTRFSTNVANETSSSKNATTNTKERSGIANKSNSNSLAPSPAFNLSKTTACNKNQMHKAINSNTNTHKILDFLET